MGEEPVGSQGLLSSPTIVGIVNVTEDSFSDGGRFLAPQAALAHARALREAGADVIELGAASSNPASTPVGYQEEIRRLAPLIDELGADDLALSVDSTSPETQQYCLERGVAYLNDIAGFSDPQIYPSLASSTARLVVMHSIQRGGPATREAREPAAVLEGIERFFDERITALERAGVARERLIIDPGMGFFLGSNPEPSIAVLRKLEGLGGRFDLPVMVSVSRKSFLGAITGKSVEGRAAATLAAEIYAAANGADYLRTHDVAALADALAVWSALEGN